MIDISGITYFMPIISFVFVFVILFAILNKSKILGENSFVQAITAIIIAIIFASVSSVREYVESVTPWFAVFFIALFFIILIAALAVKDIGSIVKPGLVWVFVALIALTFLVVAYFSFDLATNSSFIWLKRFLTRGKISGSIWLLVVALVAGIAITRKAKS